MQGGAVRISGATVMLRPALESAERWAAMSGIAGPPRVVRNDSITVRQWGPAPNGALVIRAVVKGHRHSWLSPDADRLPERLVGPRRNALNATETMWGFFARTVDRR
jgi:poly(3-hydroxybutyrate) depolymerase